MRVLIAGCGYVGCRVGAELSRLGHSVWGLRRTGSEDSTLRAAGIAPVHADLTRPETLADLDPDYDHVVHCVAASGGGVAEYERVYYEGTQNLVSWLRTAQLAKLVFTSSTSVYGQTDASWVDENSPTKPSAATAEVIVRTELLLRELAAKSNLPAVILRVAGIYGPGRCYWLDQVRTGAARRETAPRYLNMIHRDDVAGAVLAALELGRPGLVYNVADDEPVEQRVLLEWIAGFLKQPAPAESDVPGSSSKRGWSNKRISNRRLKAELRYRLIYPTFREGYAAIAGG